MDRNKLKIVFGAAAAFFLIVSIVLFILGAVLNVGTLIKVIIFIMAAIGLVLTAALGYFALLMMDKDPNYFLYDPKTKRNRSVQGLTFQIINARMNRFLSNYASSEGKIWNDRVLDNPYIDMPDEFKPLVAYKLLYSLAEKDAEAGWNCLENASDATVRFICDGLVANNDDKFVAEIEKMMARPVNINAARDYLVRNKTYMQAKMKKYVVDNIELFGQV